MEPIGLRVTLRVSAPDGCPVGDVSASANQPVDSITWDRSDEGSVTEEFTTAAAVDRSDVSPMFESGGRTRYRFSRDSHDRCVCEAIEREGYPLESIRATDDQLVLSFYAPDLPAVRTLVSELRAAFEEVHLEQLCQATDGEDGDLVVVENCQLSDRQREVLEIAHENGYFAHPKETNGSQLADKLDISLSTFTEHLSKAQQKVLTGLLNREREQSPRPTQ